MSDDIYWISSHYSYRVGSCPRSSTHDVSICLHRTICDTYSIARILILASETEIKQFKQTVPSLRSSIHLITSEDQLGPKDRQQTSDTFVVALSLTAIYPAAESQQQAGRVRVIPLSAGLVAAEQGPTLGVFLDKSLPLTRGSYHVSIVFEAEDVLSTQEHTWHLAPRLYQTYQFFILPANPGRRKRFPILPKAVLQKIMLAGNTTNSPQHLGWDATVNIRILGAPRVGIPPKNLVNLARNVERLPELRMRLKFFPHIPIPHGCPLFENDKSVLDASRTILKYGKNLQQVSTYFRPHEITLEDALVDLKEIRHLTHLSLVSWSQTPSGYQFPQVPTTIKSRLQNLSLANGFVFGHQIRGLSSGSGQVLRQLHLSSLDGLKDSHLYHLFLTSTPTLVDISIYRCAVEKNRDEFAFEAALPWMKNIACVRIQGDTISNRAFTKKFMSELKSQITVLYYTPTLLFPNSDSHGIGLVNAMKETNRDVINLRRATKVAKERGIELDTQGWY